MQQLPTRRASFNDDPVRAKHVAQKADQFAIHESEVIGNVENRDWLAGKRWAEVLAKQLPVRLRDSA